MSERGSDDSFDEIVEPQDEVAVDDKISQRRDRPAVASSSLGVAVLAGGFLLLPAVNPLPAFAKAAAIVAWLLLAFVCFRFVRKQLRKMPAIWSASINCIAALLLAGFGLLTLFHGPSIGVSVTPVLPIVFAFMAVVNVFDFYRTGRA